jgi:hypothetical protein
MYAYYLLILDMKVPGVKPSLGDFLTLSSPEKIHRIKNPLQTKSPLVLKPKVEGQDATGAVVFEEF